MRSDCEHIAKCGNFSRYYCRLHCGNRHAGACDLIIPIRHRKSKEHRRNYKDDWAKRNRDKVSRSRRNLKTKRAKWLDGLKKENGCCICGYSKCAKSIDCHHIEKKECTISTMFRLSYSLPRIKRELTKCVFVCKNCHYEVHFNISQIPDNARRIL